MFFGVLRALLWVSPSNLVPLLGVQSWFGTFFKTTIPGDQSELKSLGFWVNTVPWGVFWSKKSDKWDIHHLTLCTCRARKQFLKKLVLGQSIGLVSRKILMKKKFRISKIFTSKWVRSWNQKKNQNTFCPMLPEKNFCATI